MKQILQGPDVIRTSDNFAVKRLPAVNNQQDAVS